MPEIKKNFKLCSVEVNQKFLQELGEILENESKNFKRQIDLEIGKEIITETEKINKRNYYSAKEKKQEIEEFSKHIKNIKNYDCDIQCTLNSKDEELTVGLIEELISLHFFPDKILSIIFRYSIRNDNYVSTYLKLEGGEISPLSYFGNDCTIHSTDKAKLLEIEENLKNLFKKYKTSYAWFCDWRSRMIIIFTLAILSIETIKKFISFSFSSSTASFFLFYIACVFIVYFLLKLFEYLYPYNNFSLSGRKNIRDVIKAVTYAFIFGIIVNVLYELIKFIFR